MILKDSVPETRAVASHQLATGVSLQLVCLALQGFFILGSFACLSISQFFLIPLVLSVCGFVMSGVFAWDLQRRYKRRTGPVTGTQP